MIHWIHLIKAHLIAAFSCLWDRWIKSYLHFTVFKHSHITSDPSILETWKHCDYMYFIETNPMNHKSLNSDHWSSRKCDLTFCKNSNFEKILSILTCAKFTTCPSLLNLERWNLVIRFAFPICSESEILISLELTDGKLFAFFCF